MNWEIVKDDTYYRGRRLEVEARNASDPNQWHGYAELKTLKGSYALGIHGYMNAACLFEARGETDAAVAAYEKGLSAAMQAEYKELAVILAYRTAQIHEQAKDWNACITVYEKLAIFCEEKKAYFLAADAYEHAAEIMVQTGMDVTHYSKPINIWKQNAKHWEEHGHDDDAAWSRQHIELYKKLFGVTK
jgi:tetratricopeptide (TPR) repeat protein